MTVFGHAIAQMTLQCWHSACKNTYGPLANTGDGHVQKGEYSRSVCLRQERLEKLSSILSVCRNFCSMAKMEAWLKLIKPRLESTLGKGVYIVPLPVRYFIVKILMMDFALPEHQKWHKGCWQLPFDTIQRLKLPIASLYGDEGENLRLYSQ